MRPQWVKPTTSASTFCYIFFLSWSHFVLFGTCIFTNWWKIVRRKSLQCPFSPTPIHLKWSSSTVTAWKDVAVVHLTHTLYKLIDHHIISLSHLLSNICILWVGAFLLMLFLHERWGPPLRPIDQKASLCDCCWLSSQRNIKLSYNGTVHALQSGLL